jgi:formylglycine-generating enzyme required for sulfatase activity
MGRAQEEVTRRLKGGKDGDVPGGMPQPISSETPLHRVKITRAFYLSACEVTNAQYSHVTGTIPSYWKNADWPVEQVSWDDAVTYCRRLSDLRGEKFGAGEYRLPTEAEWEYAARAGTTTAFCSGDDPATLSDFAWTRENSGMTVHAVGQKKANNFGLSDVYGNVWEWCADGFSVDFYKRSPAADPFLSPTERSRILRGGGWGNSPPECFRSAYRNCENGDLRNTEVGFRVARSISAQTTTPKDIKRPAGTGSPRSSAGSRGFAPPPAVAPFSAE